MEQSMLNLVVKSAAYTMATLLVRDSYPTIKKTCIEAYDYVYDFLCFKGDEPPSNPTLKGKFKLVRNKLTQYQYEVIMDAYEINSELPKGEKINQQELCNRLNKSLDLHYTRSGFAHMWFKRVIPTFGEKNE